MRKSQLYRVSKLRLIHKRSGMKWLEQFGFSIGHNHQGESRKWFTGYKEYSSEQEVKDLLSRGKPMSCFSLDGDHKRVHIAFKQKETRCISVSYLTLECKKSPIVRDTGTHFCPFEMTGTKLNKQRADMNVTDYSIMMPLACGKNSFTSCLYTLIYSDWQVLRCSEDKGAGKGKVTVDPIFSVLCQTDR